MGKSLILSIGGGGGGKTKKRRSTKKAGIRKAAKRSGKFTRYCKKKGHKGANKACIKSTMKDGTRHRKRQAQFVKNLGVFAKKGR